MRSRRAHLLLLAILAVAGCYRVTPPDQYACSAAEPRCPEGLRCNGSKCVAGTPDARQDGAGACASWSAWTCDWLSTAGTHGISTCGDRTLDCTVISFQLACTCKIGNAAPTTCPGPMEGILLCDDVCPFAFSKGCCKP
jgi:hypothetical protein